MRKTFEIRGWRPWFAKILRSLEQFVWTVKDQNNFWWQNAFLTCSNWKKYWDLKVQALVFSDVVFNQINLWTNEEISKFALGNLKFVANISSLPIKVLNNSYEKIKKYMLVHYWMRAQNLEEKLKVSKSRKQILKFSFEPKKRTKIFLYFCPSL